MLVSQYVALMESDDTRPPHAFAALFHALAAPSAASVAAGTPSPRRAHQAPALWRGCVDAVCSEVELVDDTVNPTVELVDDTKNPTVELVDDTLNPTVKYDGGAVGTAAAVAADSGGSAATSAALALAQRSRAVTAKWAGMGRYLGWQNALAAPLALAQNRFVEIPALHQTCLYPR